MAKPRGRETVADMVRSLAVVGAVVAALFLVVVWQRPEGGGGDVRAPVDVAGVLAAVEATGPFPVLVPVGLPAGWTPTSAWFEPTGEEVDGGVLHLGYTTPGRSYAQVRQTDGALGDVVAAWTDDARPTGEPVVLAGLRWERLSTTTGARALVARRSTGGGPVVLVVDGKADWSELEELAASLR